LVFVGVLFLARLFSRLSRRLAQRALDSRPGGMSQLLRDVLVSMVGGTVMAVGVLVALSQVGISLAPMLAGLGVAGFILGFALQDTLSNFAAGGMILAYRPFDVDDHISVAGIEGIVKRMNLVATTITTFDNQSLIVPNSKIWGDVIRNYTSQRVRRVDAMFSISYGDSIEQAEEVLAGVLKKIPAVLESPEPVIRVNRHADNSIDMDCRPWVRTEDYWPTYFTLQREVKLAFDEAGITIPFPQRDVHHFYPDGEGSEQAG
ncbi:MAG: mechanosensitive ion channel family protein, partial [Luminiphilus sp.]